MSENVLVAFRVGAVMLLDKVLDESSMPEAFGKRAELVRKEVGDLIADSPIVMDRPSPALGGALSTQYQLWNEGRYRTFWSFAPPTIFRVHWPGKNQEVFSPYPGPFVEDFILAFNGFGFACAAKCARPLPRAYSFEFGREGWRILKAILGESPEWDFDITGPSPMRPIAYVAFTSDPTTYSPDFDLVREGDTRQTLTVLAGSNEDELNHTVRDMLVSLLGATEFHFRSLAIRHEFMERQEALDKAFEAAAQGHRDLLTVRGWNPRRWAQRLNAGRRIRGSVGEAYAEYMHMIEVRRSLEHWVRYAKEAFQRQPLLAPVSEYCDEVTEDVFKWTGEHILHGLAFFGEESRSQGLEAATVQAAGLGAAIAGGTAALLWLLT